MLGDMSIEVLKTAVVSCDKIKQAGFTFLHPSVISAIHKLVAS
jgi:NAD dependent epimerase/dehydratase family enzyme